MNEPTTAEIEAVLAAWDSGDGGYIVTRGHVDAHDARRALTAVLPLVEARLREEIAAEIEASPREGQYAPDWHAAGRREDRAGQVMAADGWPPPDCGLTLQRRCPFSQVGDRRLGFPCSRHRHDRCSGFTGGYDDALYTCACGCHRVDAGGR